MNQQSKPRLMTAETFVDWAMNQPVGRFELLRGEVVAMSPERVGHARVKTAVLLALHSALAAEGSSCEGFGDGMAVRIDDTTVYEPDASVRCGARLSNDDVLFDDPEIVVEVVRRRARASMPAASLRITSAWRRSGTISWYIPKGVGSFTTVATGVGRSSRGSCSRARRSRSIRPASRLPSPISSRPFDGRLTGCTSPPFRLKGALTSGLRRNQGDPREGPSGDVERKGHESGRSSGQDARPAARPASPA